MKGEMYVSVSDEEFKEKEKVYRGNYAEFTGGKEKGWTINWKNAEIGEFTVEDNELTVDLECAGVFVSVTIPLSFEQKIAIVKELRSDLDTLKELKLL